MISAKEARETANACSVRAEELIKIIGDIIEKEAKHGQFKTEVLMKPTLDPRAVDFLLNQLRDLGYDFYFTRHEAPRQPSIRYVLTERNLNYTLHIEW